jgi:hypothetical protein
MATLAGFFQETSARRNSRADRPGRSHAGAAKADAASNTEAARAQADPYALRALPNDGIYFYSKKIDNSRVQRQADPDARGQCWSAVGAAGVLLMLGASIIAPHVGSVLEGYKLESLKQERQALLDQKRELDVNEAVLLSPERLNSLAKLHSLTSPASDQVIHLDAVPTTDGSFARNQAPAATGLQPSAR